MSKLTKFFKHPVIFFRDSKLFGKPDVSDVKKCKNLFFIAHYGQLEQIQALIKYEKLTDCFVCVLYTPANKKMPKTIEENIDYSLISGSYLAKLPVSPNRIHIENLVYIQRLYCDIVNKACPCTIFLLSFEVHYALIAAQAKNKSIQLALVEEGTATYKFDQNGRNLAPIVDLKRYKRAIFLITYVPFFKKLRPALATHRDFDYIYAAFPELLKGAFNCKSTTRFLLHAPGGKKLDNSTLAVVDKYNITSNDLVFVSQRYAVDVELLYTIVIKFLFDIALQLNCKVFLKLHPKESEKTVNSVLQLLEKLNVQEKVVLIEENSFLIEPAIAYVKPRAIIGISSTSLVYAALVSSRTVSISLGEFLLSKLVDVPKDKRKDVEVIKSHLNILKKFPDVYCINMPDEAIEIIKNGRLKSKAMNSCSLDTFSSDEFLQKADKYFNDGKHWKAHCHYEWGFRGEPEKIPLLIFKKYYLNLLFLNDENLLIENTYSFLKRVYNKEGFFSLSEKEVIFISLINILDHKIILRDKDNAIAIYKFIASYFPLNKELSLAWRFVIIVFYFGNFDNTLLFPRRS